MSDERLFLDTSFIQALLNRRDQYHEKAKTMFPRVRDARSVLLTEAILVEVGNALCRFDRTAAAEFLDSCLSERRATEGNLTISQSIRLSYPGALVCTGRLPTRNGGSQIAFPSSSCERTGWLMP